VLGEGLVVVFDGLVEVTKLLVCGTDTGEGPIDWLACLEQYITADPP